MAKLPSLNTTKSRLDRRRTPAEFGRTYLGMSTLGDPCARKLWYGFHWASKKFIRARTERIFDVGHAFEAIAIADLKAIGVEVYKIENGVKTELTGIKEDQETLLGFCGHESGHSDGRAMGFIEYPTEEMLLELKTMKESYFNTLKKKGVQETFPTYYAQVQRYMREKKLKRCAFMAINKNTCEYYIEFFEYDKGVADDLARKGREIIMSDKPPEKEYIAGYFKCFQCDHPKVCHYDHDPAMNCRTCNFSNIENNGVWVCTNRRHIDEVSKGQCEGDYELNEKEQRKGCDQWKKGWGL